MYVRAYVSEGGRKGGLGGMSEGVRECVCGGGGKRVDRCDGGCLPACVCVCVQIIYKHTCTHACCSPFDIFKTIFTTEKETITKKCSEDQSDIHSIRTGITSWLIIVRV